jgi:hypothetical protein
MMVRREWLGHVLYVGETGEAGGYLGAGHHKWDSARRLGMNELVVHRLYDRERRLNLETLLRHQFRPPLNDQPIPTANEAILNALAGCREPATPFTNAMAVAREYAQRNALTERHRW